MSAEHASGTAESVEAIAVVETASTDAAVIEKCDVMATVGNAKAIASVKSNDGEETAGPANATVTEPIARAMATWLVSGRVFELVAPADAVAARTEPILEAALATTVSLIAVTALPLVL